MFDQVCGRLHGLLRAGISDSLGSNASVPFKESQWYVYKVKK